MDAHEELVLRLAEKRSKKLGLSKNGYAELVLAVRKDPEKFVDDEHEEAFLCVAKALDRYEESDSCLRLPRTTNRTLFSTA